MPLTIGVRLGLYEIVGALGSGGMGEVYRARDTKLGREVAIKALPDQFLTDPERVARFEREAQLLAALNHPNIAAIHGLQESNGAQFLVLELVDGESLAERIARGLIGITESLVILRQIIDALESAHEKGIIHRDLKPANIMLTRDDRVKILDFGLAKALEPDPVRADLSHSPTMTLGATGAGVILGTAAYMAPEQIKGRAADKRSDIWACGCVLFEMLTGKRAFIGEDVSDTLAAVLRGEPDWLALPAYTPSNIRTLLKRCLQKDRRARVGDVSTVRYVLDEAAVASGVPGTTPATSARRSKALPFVALAASASVAAVVTWAVTRPGPSPIVQPVRFTIAPSGDAISVGSPHADLAITPDGTHVVYIAGGASGGLWVRRLDQLEAVQLRGLPGINLSGPAISPDSKWIAFASATDLMRVSLTGGSPISLTNAASTTRGIAWRSDDTIVFATNDTATGLLSVPAAGGDPTVLTKPDPQKGEFDHLFPSVLPGGRAVLFTITTPSGLDSAQVAVLDLVSGDQKILVRGGSQAVYAQSGHLIYAAGGALRAVRFDPARLEVLSDPTPVVDQVVTKTSGAADFSISTNGTLVFVPGGGGATAMRSLVWVTREGVEEPIKGVPPRAFFMARLSPDGSRIALDVRDQQNDIWIWDLAQETLTPLTIDRAQDMFPVWTPIGNRVIFASNRTGVGNLYWQAADGTGVAEQLVTSLNTQYGLSITEDGRQLVIRDNSARGADLSVVHVDEKRRVEPLLQGAYVEDNGAISPDGQWLAYESTESGRSEVYVRPFPNVNSGRFPISTAGGSKPVWAPNGRELFYLDGDGHMTAVPVQTTGAFTRGAPKKLFTTRYFGTNARNYDVSRDGQKFLMIKELSGAATPATPINVVLNWFEELNARVGR
jgi:serine/threonine protein kinase/Tol biopolymer transport system component